MRDESPQRFRRLLIRVVRLVLFAYVAILLFLVTMETRLVFPGAYFGDSEEFQSDDTDITTVDVDPADDVALPARLREHNDPQNFVLFLHGNGVRAAQLDQWTRRLSRSFEATVLTAEYRGYEDDRTPSETGIIEDALAANDFLQEKYGLSPDEIIIYGRSLGGGCAAALASSSGAKALVLDRTFDAIWKVAASKYPFVPVRLLMRNRFESANRLADYRGPLVQIHGTTDTLIPVKRGRALFEQLSTTRKVWIEVPGMEHNDRMSDQLLRRIVVETERLAAPES